MRRILLVLTVALVMAAMLTVLAAPAFAVPGGSKGIGFGDGAGGGQTANAGQRSEGGGFLGPGQAKKL